MQDGIVKEFLAFMSVLLEKESLEMALLVLLALLALPCNNF